MASISRWRARARCFELRLEPELFFPLQGQPVDRAVVAACRECLVRTYCAAAALDSGVRWGVWAGVRLGTGQQRTRERLQAIAGRATT